MRHLEEQNAQQQVAMVGGWGRGSRTFVGSLCVFEGGDMHRHKSSKDPVIMCTCCTIASGQELIIGVDVIKDLEAQGDRDIEQGVRGSRGSGRGLETKWGKLGGKKETQVS